MSEPYVLFGSYASYYTAKSRTYLRKKGIPFVEHLPSDPVFREKVRPASGSHRIPQLLTPEGDVIQDSVEIVDTLEVRFPDVPAFPESPLQRVYVHLMELLGSEGLVQLAWMHRWLFPENDFFVKMDFGRSFRPQGSDAELREYGQLIADRMTSYGLPEATRERRAALDDAYRALLARFEAHFVEHPYLLGGHPSAADHAVMGALHAHLGRDPAGLRVMQDNAPRVFRWVEHMLTPELQSPEFFDRAVAFPEDDTVPETALDVLRFIADQYGERFVRDVLAFEEAMAEAGAGAGFAISPDEDQPTLPARAVAYGGADRQHASAVYAVWIAQRSQRVFHALPDADRARVEKTLDSRHCVDLLNAPFDHPIARRDNRFVVA